MVEKFGLELPNFGVISIDRKGQDNQFLLRKLYDPSSLFHFASPASLNLF
jgi:hypothetical protein